MTSWLASLLAALLPKLLQYFWSIASVEIKKQVAAKEFKDWMKKDLASYEALVRKIDDLEEQGVIDPTMSEKLKNEKIKIETDLLNGVHRS